MTFQTSEGEKITWFSETSYNRLGKKDNENLFGNSQFQIILYAQDFVMQRIILRPIIHTLAESKTPTLLTKLC